jgi:hypothetical protein
MLDAAKPFLLDRRNQLSILDQTGGRISVVGVEAKDVSHARKSDTGDETAAMWLV